MENISNSLIDEQNPTLWISVMNSTKRLMGPKIQSEFQDHIKIHGQIHSTQGL